MLVEDVLQIHHKSCGGRCRTVQLSFDGVSHAKSSPVSLDIWSTSFTDCRVIYPLTIVQPVNRFHVPYRPYLNTIINDLHDNQCKITHFIGDNPKRALIREALNHASHYACEYCESKASRTVSVPKADTNITNISDTIQYLQELSGSSRVVQTKDKHLKSLIELQKHLGKNKSRSYLVWPFTTSKGQLRSDQMTLEIVSEMTDATSHDRARGFIARSLFLDIEYFNFTENIPAEYMHSACLGLIKRVIELTFTVGEKRTRITNRRLSPPTKYNKLMSAVKVPREFSRRVRNLDLSVIKAQEYRNITLFFFPIVVQCIEPSAKERRLWLLLSYMIRSCVIPNTEFSNISSQDLTAACDKFMFYMSSSSVKKIVLILSI